MTEADARVVLRDCAGDGGLEAWIAGRRWKPASGGWTVTQGCSTLSTGVLQPIDVVQAEADTIRWREAQGSPHFGLMLSEMEESEWGCWIGRMNQEGHVVVGFVPGFGSP